MRARRRAAQAPLGSARPAARSDTLTPGTTKKDADVPGRCLATDEGKDTLKLFGAVQEPVRPDARESYPMGQGRTWRPLDAAAQRHR